MRKIIATAALAGALTLTGAAAASATYPANPATGGVDSGTTTPGGTTNLTGSGMTSGENVVVTIDCTDDNGASSTTSETVVANADGSFSYAAVMNTSGQCSLSAVGASSGAIVTAQVTVAGEVTTQAAPAGADLAETGLGTSTALWGAAGVGALTLGTAAVVMGRRRNATAGS